MIALLVLIVVILLFGADLVLAIIGWLFKAAVVILAFVLFAAFFTPHWIT